MSYENIAELVHDLVKSSKSLLSIEHGLTSTKLKTNELAIIQRVFTKYEESGDVLMLEYLPLRFWA